MSGISNMYYPSRLFRQNVDLLLLLDFITVISHTLGPQKLRNLGWRGTNTAVCVSVD